MKRKRLEYVSVVEKVELINSMRRLGYGHPHPKNQAHLPEITKTKEENRLEKTKRKLKQPALDWVDLDIRPS